MSSETHTHAQSRLTLGVAMGLSAHEASRRSASVFSGNAATAFEGSPAGAASLRMKEPWEEGQAS